MRKLYLIIACVFIGCGIFYACSNENLEVVAEIETVSSVDTSLLTPEALTLKESAIISLKKLKYLQDNNLSRSVKDMACQKNDILKELTKQTIAMFNSYGLEDSWEEFESLEDPRIALIGIMFVGLLEANDVLDENPFLRSRASEGMEFDDCYDAEKIAACVFRALVGIDWNEIYSAFAAYGCITKAIAKQVLIKLASSTTLAISVTVALYEFTTCMGWI